MISVTFSTKNGDYLFTLKDEMLHEICDLHKITFSIFKILKEIVKELEFMKAMITNNTRTSFF